MAVFADPLKEKVSLTQPTVMVTFSPLGYTVSLAGLKVAPTLLCEVQFAPPSSSDSVTVHWKLPFDREVQLFGPKLVGLAVKVGVAQFHVT